MSIDHEAMIAELERSGLFRVLRRIPRARECTAPTGEIGRALLVDVETTGTDPKQDALIELALLPFEYEKSTGRICKTDDVLSFLEDPGRPIPAEVTKMTGITDEMVRGQRIDEHQVEKIVSSAALFVAHSASFDRKFFERRFNGLRGRAWACSIEEIPWRPNGASSRALDYLVFKHCGAFFTGHRAGEDCRALLELLATPFASGDLPFRLLLESARRRTVRIRAIGSPFESKDLLKARGYRWSGGKDDGLRCWHRDVFEEDSDVEFRWLREIVYVGLEASFQTEFLDARSRYADERP